MLNWHPSQAHHNESRDNKSKQTGHQPLPISASDKIEPGEDNAHPQQHAAEKPERR